LKPGDQATFVLPDGAQAELTISAVVDLGSAAANKASAFVGEAQARGVLSFAADQYSSIDTQLGGVFASKTVAEGSRASLRSRATRVTGGSRRTPTCSTLWAPRARRAT
jgi:hypothetical protein